MAEDYFSADKTASGMESLETSFVRWAESALDIRAALVVGSRARTDHPADEWADLDIMFFTTTPEKYLFSYDWLNKTGHVLLHIAATTAGGDPEQLVIYEGGLFVDFVILNFDNLKRLIQIEKKDMIFIRGFRVLVDKEDIAAGIPHTNHQSPPTSVEIQEKLTVVSNGFWYGALYIAKMLRRGALWIAIFRLTEMRNNMLKLIELHSHVTRDWDYDTWHMGQFLEEWADPHILTKLPALFTLYETTDCWRALFAHMDLFCWIVQEITENTGIEYPDTAEKSIKELITRLHSESYS